MKRNILSGKRVGVIGLARSGAAAANLAKRLGAEVLVSEARKKREAGGGLKLLDKGISSEFGGHSEKLLQSDLIIKSPGVHGDIPVIKKARNRNIPVIGEIEFALGFINPAKLVAITGTNGKTTTTTLVGEIFKAAGMKTVVAGNIGAPPAAAAKKIGDKTNLVLEVSSYQLEDSPGFKPDISAILNITPDHLEHHRTMGNYIRAKSFIFKNQDNGGFCVLNHDDSVLRKFAAKCPARIVFFSRRKKIKNGVYHIPGKIVSSFPGNRFTIDISLKIPGPHNIENALAAAAVSVAAGVKPSVIKKVLNSFRGVEHRIEFCGAKRGVEYYNDSKGTNVDSTRVALESFDGNIWLILGGLDKGAPYAPLRGLIRKKVKGIMLIGEAAGKIKKELSGTAPFYDCVTLARAVKKAARFAGPGDTVLLSPACASFDQFKDYEDRGLRFKAFVKKLA